MIRLALALAALAAAPTWTLITNEAAFSPRDTAEGVVFHDRLWLSNGYYHGNVLHRDLWSSADGATWERVSGATPYDGYSEMAVYQDKLWAVKGSVWTSSDGRDWTLVLAETPFGSRGYGELVVHDDKLWQLGSGADVWHSEDGITWTAATTEAPYGVRVASGVVAFKDALWLLGGRTEATNDPPEKQYPQFTTHNDVWRSTDGSAWKRVLAEAPWSSRMWFGAVAFDGKLWVIGGFDNRNGANLGDVWYTEDGVSWTELEAEESFAPRHEMTPYVFQNTLWVMAGNTWPVVNDVWRLAEFSEKQ
jgi:hypothetical protein